VVDVYTYLSSRRLLTPPTHAEKMFTCMDRMAFAWQIAAQLARMGFFLFFVGVIHLATSLHDIHLATSLCDQFM